MVCSRPAPSTMQLLTAGNWRGYSNSPHPFLRPLPRCCNDVLQRTLSLPFEGAFGNRGIGDQLRRIARTPRTNLRWNRMSSDMLDGFDNLFHRVALPSAEVHGH